MPEIRDIVPPQTFFLPGHLWLWVLAVGWLLSVVLSVWLLRRGLRQLEVIVLPSPQEDARERLDALRGRVDGLDGRAFGGEAADILRAFIGAEYRLPAQRQTSPEFLDSVRGSTRFSTTQHGVLADFLDQCDLLKFARQDATRDGKLRLIDQVALFLDTDPKPSPAPMPDHRPPPLPGLSRQPPPLPPAGDRYPYESPESRYMPPV